MKQRTMVKRVSVAVLAILWVMAILSNICSSSFYGVMQTYAAETTETTEGTYLSEFLKSGYDATRATVYDGLDKEKYFCMNGRRYYQGIVMGSNNYQEGGSISYNVEDISAISFVVCRVDNSGMRDITLSIHRDGNPLQDVKITSMETWKKVELDVSDCTAITIFYNTSNTMYGLAEFSVDGQSDEETFEIPNPGTNAALINSSYDAYRIKKYDCTNPTESFMMNGRRYYQGIVLGNNNYQEGGSFTFNVEKIKKLYFVLGRVDNTGMNGTTFQIYFDGALSQEIKMENLSLWQEVELDVADVSVVRFYYTTSNTQYAMGNIQADFFPVEIEEIVPKYETNAQFIDSRFDSYRNVSYDGTNELKYFFINGRKYYQGIVIGNNNYQEGGSLSFNVENVKTLRFTLGRIDNTGMNGIKFTVYRDGAWWQDIDMESLTVRNEVELDVSDISVIRFYYTQSNTQYAMANIEVDALEADPAVVPEYKTNVEFINSRYDSYRNETYDATNENKYFMMNGRKYYQGIVIGNNNYQEGGSMTFNVENVKKLRFTVGRIDNTGMNDISLKIYRDGYWWQDIAVGNQEIWKEVELDVTKISTLRILYTNSNTKYALANIMIDELPLEMEPTSPVYENGAELIKAKYDNYRDKAYDGSNSFNYFMMNAKEYYQGIILGSNNYQEGGYVSFNVENADSFTFTLGKIDNVGSKDIVLHIMKDGNAFYSLPVSAGLGTQEYIIDTKDNSVLRFYYTESHTQYAMANIALNGDYSEFTDGTYDFEQKVYTDPSKIISIDDLANPNFLGDVNLDGEVNALDASEVLVAAALVGSGDESGLTEAQQKLADVNFDETFNASDAAGILQFAAAKGSGYKGTSNEFFDELQKAE